MEQPKMPTGEQLLEILERDEPIITQIRAIARTAMVMEEDVSEN